jgi:anti-anti-sigma factor
MIAMARPVPERPSFQVDVTERDGSTVVALAGDLDLATTADAGAAIRAALARGPVLLDLRALVFMDSSGAHLLDGLVRDAAREGWTLRVDPEVGMGVRRALEITGLLDVLPFEGAEGGQEAG